MSEAIVAKRYAEALFQLGNEKSTLDQLLEEFGFVHEVFTNNEQLFTFLEHPRVRNAQKKALLEEAFQGFSKDVVNTIQLLVDRHRIEIISSVIEHFEQLVNEIKGIAEATVYSVRPLADKETEELEETLSKRYNKKSIKIKNVVDPSLIGGLRIRIGNTIYDGSVSGKLKRIERNILKVNN